MKKYVPTSLPWTKILTRIPFMDNFTIPIPGYPVAVSFYDKPAVPSLETGNGIYIADTNTVPLLKQADGFNPECPLVVLEAGETAKNLRSIECILKTALEASLGRDGIFAGFGGGVITDMTAFAASLYMRGARCELVPTTLLAMADAAIGGKTGVDFENYKNCVGTFYPAQHIHIAPSVLSTLPEEEYRSGLAEVVKTAMLYDPFLLDLLEKKKMDILRGESSYRYEMVNRCARAKAGVVERDLRESGERMFLNLGHTFGHALESVAGFGAVSHGKAVAWGIGRAMELGLRLGITDPVYAERIRHILSAYGWPVGAVHPLLAGEKSSGTDSSETAMKLLAAMKNDKKKKGGVVRFVLQRALNDTFVTEVSDSDVLEILR